MSTGMGFLLGFLVLAATNVVLFTIWYRRELSETPDIRSARRRRRKRRLADAP